MRTQKWIQTGLLTVAFSAMMVGCNDSQYPGFKKLENGVHIKYHHKGDGKVSPALNDIVTLDMIYGTGDTVLFESTKLPEPLTFPVIEPTFDGDLYDALSILHVGDSVTIAFPADSFFMVMAGMPQSPEFVKPGATMYFDIKLKTIQTEAEMKAEQHAMLEQMKQQEQEALKAYLAEKNITSAPLESGLYYMEQVKGKGPKPQPGDVLKVKLSVAMLGGMPLFSNFDKEPMEIEYGQPFDTKGFDEALGYLVKGTKASLIVPSHIAFDSMGRSQMIPPYATMLYDVELVDIKPKAVVEKERAELQKKEAESAQQAKQSESAKISAYIKKNNITVSPTASGLYYIENVKGTGKSPVSGKSVKVNYTLYNINGDKLQSSLDSGTPFTFVVGLGNVIQGWDEGIMLMKEGGKARLLIPSSLGYGDVARSAEIPAYSPLVFDIELLEVLDK